MDDNYQAIISLCKNSYYSSDTDNTLQEINKISGWKNFINIIEDHGLLSVVYEQLERNYKTLLPDSVVSELKDRYLQITINNINKGKELLKIYEILTANKIDVLTFKGPALSCTAYGDITKRKYTDIDLIVEPANVGKAKQLLIKTGYVPQFNLSNEYVKIYLRNWYYENFYSPEAKNTVDLHWRSEKSAYSFSIDFNNLKNGHKTVRILNTEKIKTFSDEINTIYLCQHGCKHGWEQIVWILDIHKHIESSDNLDWGTTLNKAYEFHSFSMLKTGLILAHMLFETRLPNHIKELIYKDKKLLSFSSWIVSSICCEKRHINNHLFLKPSDRVYIKTMNYSRDKIRYILSFLCPTPLEWELGLPRHLYFVYYLYRPLRLFKSKVLNK